MHFVAVSPGFMFDMLNMTLLLSSSARTTEPDENELEPFEVELVKAAREALTVKTPAATKAPTTTTELARRPCRPATSPDWIRVRICLMPPFAVQHLSTCRTGL